MRYILIIMLLAVMSCSDGEKYDGTYIDLNKYKNTGVGIYVVTIDSCEYVVYNGTYKGGIVHKENCGNSFHERH